jgi:hypothetical protein
LLRSEETKEELVERLIAAMERVGIKVNRHGEETMKRQANNAHVLDMKIREAERERQNEVRLRMKYGDFRYEIAEEVADHHSRTTGPTPEVEKILEMMEMTGW